MKKKYQKPTLLEVQNLGGLTCKKLATLPNEEFESYFRKNKELEYSKVYQASRDASLRQMGDEWLLIPIYDVFDMSNGLYAINSTSRFLWEQFQTPSTIAEVLAKAKEVYDDPDNCMETHIRKFVNEYVKHKLLKEEKK